MGRISSWTKAWDKLKSWPDEIDIFLTLFIFPNVCQYYVSVLPCLQKSSPICVCQVHPDLFLLHLQPLNKPCACLKMKKKYLRGITLQGFWNAWRGLITKMFFLLLASFLPSGLSGTLAASRGASFSGYCVHLVFIASPCHWTYIGLVNYVNFYV